MKWIFQRMAFFVALLFLPHFAGHAQVGVVNDLSHERVVRPGETYEGVIILKNYGNEEGEVKLYQTDYSFNYEGKAFYDQPGKNGRSNAAWVKFSPKQLTIAPLGQAEVQYSVKVPDDQALVGTYWSIIMVENVPGEQTLKGEAARKKGVLAIHQVMRYGVQVVNHIGDMGTRKLKFLNAELREGKSQRTFQVDVENVGERWLRPFSYTELYNEKGELVGKVEGDRWRIFPGTSARFAFDMTGLPGGKYRVLIILDNKDAYVFGAQYNLNFTALAKEPENKF
ncbi:MAG: hypothetical protein QHH14_07810 [Clostridiales bacterium]|nr:hypothetical protein [Clostridiales bacterium]